MSGLYYTFKDRLEDYHGEEVYAKGGITIEGNPYKDEALYIYRDGVEVLSWTEDGYNEDGYLPYYAKEMYDLYNSDKKELSKTLDKIIYEKEEQEIDDLDDARIEAWEKRMEGIENQEYEKGWKMKKGGQTQEPFFYEKGDRHIVQLGELEYIKSPEWNEETDDWDYFDPKEHGWNSVRVGSESNNIGYGGKDGWFDEELDRPISEDQEVAVDYEDEDADGYPIIIVDYVKPLINYFNPGGSYEGIKAKGGNLSSYGLSFEKVDYDVNVNPKNLEVDVNIKESDSVNHNDLNDSEADWEQHQWGYMVYPKNEKQLYDVLKALRVSVSKKRLSNFVKDGS